MDNKNTTVVWLEDKSNIFIDESILDYKNPIRGIYGIFIVDKYEKKTCEYVGRSEDIYGRMFRGEYGHIVMIRKNKHFISELNKVNDKNEVKISVEILEHVDLVFDYYCKDMQRLASAENYYINKYQSQEQCLNQVPEGKHMTLDNWREREEEAKNKKCGI